MIPMLIFTTIIFIMLISTMILISMLIPMVMTEDQLSWRAPQPLITPRSPSAPSSAQPL